MRLNGVGALTAHLRADDGGVGVNARRSGVARRRPGPQSSKYSTLSSSSSAPCLFASMASILRCVCTTLGLCLLAVPLLQTRCAFHGLRRPLSQALDALLRADAAPVADRRLRLLLRAHIRHLVGCFRQGGLSVHCCLPGSYLNFNSCTYSGGHLVFNSPWLSGSRAWSQKPYWE